MAAIFFRLFYGLWVLGMILLTVYFLSDLIFGKGDLGRKLRAFGMRLLFIPIWPLMLVTASGRSKLFSQLDNL